MSVNLAQAIVDTLGRMADAWETYLKTREAAYKRSMDKRLRKALNAAEQFILRTKEVYPEFDDKEMVKWEKIFWRYNN